MGYSLSSAGPRSWLGSGAAPVTVETTLPSATAWACSAVCLPTCPRDQHVADWRREGGGEGGEGGGEGGEGGGEGGEGGTNMNI